MSLEITGPPPYLSIKNSQTTLGIMTDESCNYFKAELSERDGGEYDACGSVTVIKLVFKSSCEHDLAF